MKKIETIITPMNCGYNTGLNTLQTWDKTEFDTDTGERKVLFYDKDVSKFSLKCGNGTVSKYGNTPYLEPVILGTTPTDIIDVEFDAKIDEEDTSVVVSSALLAIHKDNTYDYITQKEESTSVKARYETEVDTTYYKHYKTRIQLEGYKPTDKGVIYNFRYNDGITYDDDNNMITQAPTAKVTIKNLTLKIYTNNENLIADNKFVDFSTSNDMISNIKYMKNCSYSLGAEINKSYEKGYVTVSSNILSSNSSSTAYKGIAFDLGCKQVPTVCGVYFEYKNATENTLEAHMGSDTYTINDSKKVYLPVVTDWTKKIIFLENLSSTTNTESHRASLMLGTNIANANFSIRNIRLINIKNTIIDKAPIYSNDMVTYVSISDLNTRKGTSVSLVANEDNTQKLIDALDVKEQYVDWFGNSNDRFGINPKTYGSRINEFRITKMTNTDATVIAIMNSGAVLSRVYTGGTLGDWTSTGHILNDGYTDDGTIAITGQNEDSSGMYGNGVLPETLGFTRDAMTWSNGIYRISHGVDLVGLPENLQTGRLEHFNLKRWGSNSNPHTATWAERMSVFYSVNGNIYTRVQVSGATAGVITSDTGWQQIATNTFNGQATKSVTIDLSNSALQSTSSGLTSMSLASYISGSANIIRVEGYYIPPTGASTTLKKVIVRADIDNKLGGIIYTNNNWNFVVYGATDGSKGSGYAKIYYVD